MADIVERLRKEHRYMPTYLAAEAADEIERLRADNRRLRGVVRSALCPGGGYTGQPVDEYPSVKACLKAGVCGCELGAALDTP